MAKPSKVYAKTVHLYAGLDLIGSKSTIGSRDAEIEVTPIGMKVTSKKTKRCILIPYANVKGAELIQNKLEDELDTE